VSQCPSYWDKALGVGRRLQPVANEPLACNITEEVELIVERKHFPIGDFEFSND
jgi:hypothetical protein